ncbi:MAG: hypothetical protein K2Q18_19425, partial [Bdellovibrionales bacterium]|nr:hypothetical protein [Bdellovibrionales bacterium]
PKVKTAGYFDKLVKVTIQEEKAKKKTLTYFQQKALDPQFVAFNKEAQKFYQAVNSIANDDNYSNEDRIALSIAYIDNVLLPVRDLVVIMRSYLEKETDGKNYYESLQLIFSNGFVNSLTKEERKVLMEGLNSQVSPFYLEFKAPQNGMSRLAFVDSEIIRRDVLTLLKAPTSKNYVMAMKWFTLHMMISQATLYKNLVADERDIAIPKSCQNQFNGSLPATLPFSYDKEAAEKFLEGILVGHGLLPKANDNTYYDYYIENINRDPTKSGYSTLMPFENYKNALRSSEKSGALALEPQFDDVNHYQAILNFKLPEAQRIFKGKAKGQSVTFTGQETFQKFLGQYSADDTIEIKISKTQTELISPARQNLSPYLVELMQTNGFIDYSQLITETLKKKFVGKKVKIDFPSMYSSPAWRDWSLRVMSDLAYAHRDDPISSNALKIAKQGCLMTTRKDGTMAKICTQGGHTLALLADFLAEFRTGEKYIPTRRLEDAKYQEVYPFLGFLWEQYRDQLHLIPDAEPYELNYLKTQMSAGNPWARLKLSYMIALDQIENQEKGTLPKYDFQNSFSKKNEEVICKIENLSQQYNNIYAAGKVLGLDKTLGYNHASSFLTAKEKTQIWRNIYDEVQNRNSQLFSVKDGNQTYYKKFEDLSYKTILTEQAALGTGIPITQMATNEIKDVTLTSNEEISSFFLKLYNLRDPAKQQKLFADFSKEFGISNTYSTKMAFLTLDQDYKKAIYTDLLKQAAETRRLQVMSQLERFCKMDVNDENEFKNIFYSASKAQNDLNKMAGLPSVPSEVLSKVNEMSASEWRDMWWGLGSGLAGMAAVMIGVSCTGLSGGICAPLGGTLAAAGISSMAGGIVAVTGVSSIGIQVVIASNELDRHDLAEANAGKIKKMEDLGFADGGSADEVSRSYAWAALEAISIVPLIGVATKSAVLGPKLMYVSAREIARKSGREAFIKATSTVALESDVRAAQYLVQTESIAKNLGIDAVSIGKITTSLGKVKTLYIKGEITFEDMLKRVARIIAPARRFKLAVGRTLRGEIGNVTVKQTKAQIDAKVSKMISDYFSKNPQEMLRLVQDYTGDRLNNAIRIMSEIKSVDRVGQVPVYSTVKDWMLKLRNENLAKNATKLLKLEKDLAALGTDTTKLQNYIYNNLDDITEIFIDIPMKKMELPYFVFVQGMPEFTFLNGRKIPILSRMSDGQTMK